MSRAPGADASVGSVLPGAGLVDVAPPTEAPPVRRPLEPRPAVGSRAVRLDIRPHVTGGTQFIDDVSLPDMLHAKILRSEQAHARIRDIDVSEAENMPGVVATLVGAEIPVNSFGSTYKDQPVLAEDRVRHRGDPVAAVAAETVHQARAALERIRVDYEPLPAVFDPLEAIRDDAPRIHGDSNIYITTVIKKGDVERGFAQSDQIFERRYTTQMVEHSAIEPHGSVADWEPDGRLHIRSALGRITLGRADLARVLGIPIHRIQVTGTLIGGNFGGKNEITTEPITALLAKKARRPVKCVYSREEEFSGSTTRHPMIMDYRTGVTGDGRLLARRVRLVLDGGAYASWSETTVSKSTILGAGPYEIPNVEVTGLAVYTNKSVTGAMRGFGAPQVCFAYESQMDEIANHLGIDPVRVRLLNAFREGSMSHTDQALQSVVLKETLTAAASLHQQQVPS